MAGANKQPAPLTDLRQYACSPGRMAHHYAELTVSSPAVVETVSGIHCTAPLRGGQAEWSCMACENPRMVDLPKVFTDPGSNRVRRGFTLLM